MILGIDEVGRGPWAGPLVVGAVVLGKDVPEGLTDSKKLSAKRRALLDTEIRQKATGYGLGWVSASELDEIGLSAALKLATVRAVEQVKAPYHEIIIDGTINFLKETSKGKYVTTMAKADLLIPSVSAASIIAKVARDTYMAEQARVYPVYGFEGHVGYGTAAHSKAIDEHGVTPLHRLSFAPLKKYAEPGVGAEAESAAAEWLQAKGFSVVARNWKIKAAEIDIVAEKDNRLYFVECKYRSGTNQGGGLAAITPRKLQAMTKAADLYIHMHQLQNRERQLAVVELSGTPPVVTQFLELV